MPTRRAIAISMLHATLIRHSIASDVYAFQHARHWAIYYHRASSFRPLLYLPTTTPSSMLYNHARPPHDSSSPPDDAHDAIRLGAGTRRPSAIVSDIHTKIDTRLLYFIIISHFFDAITPKIDARWPIPTMSTAPPGLSTLNLCLYNSSRCAPARYMMTILMAFFQ